MFKNYFTIAWRNLLKHKVFSLINILGLSVGIAFAMLIGAYVWGELQVNRHLKDVDNQYIILSKWKDPNMGNEIECIGQLSSALKEEYPGLVANYYNADPGVTAASKGDEHFREGIQVGDSTLLNMYGFKLLHGNAATALKEPYAVVVSKEMALKFFGKTDVLGQTLNFDGFSGDNHEFLITGILDDLPRNTITGENAEHTEEFFFHPGASKFFKRSITGWGNASVVDHIELKTGADPEAVNRAMKALLNKYSNDDYIKANLTPYLVRLKDYNLIANGALVGLISLSVQKRAKEIGIRKVLGSSVAGISALFLKDFLGVLVIACLIACPLAFLIMQTWLDNYAYKIRMSPGPFVFSIIALVALTGSLIVVQTLKAAYANPVKSLKSE